MRYLFYQKDFCVLLLLLLPHLTSSFQSSSFQALQQTQRNSFVLQGLKPIVDDGTGISTSKKPPEKYDDSFIKESFEQSSPDIGTNKGVPISDLLLVEEDFPAFPFTKVVDQDHIKQAFVLAATNPQLGLPGVLLAGGHGTCKSVLARATQNLFPRGLTRIRGNSYNIEPLADQVRARKPLVMDSFLKDELRRSNTTSIRNMETERIPMPFVTVPLNVMDDGLLGSVDIEKSMETGTTCFSPGLLAKANRGILYIDDFHLLEEDIANILMNVLAEGYVSVEREGLSARYPCRPQLVVATYNPEEGDVRNTMMDRFAMVLSSDANPLSVDQRVQVVENVEGYRPGHAADWMAESAEPEISNGEEDEDELGASVSNEEIRQNIIEAKTFLPEVKIDHSQLMYLCQLATKAACEGQRAELFATEIAKTVAALHGRDHVTQEDLDYGVLLGILPRAQRPFEYEEAEPGESSEQRAEQSSVPPSSELQPLPPEPDLPQPPEATEEESEELGTEDTEAMDEDTLDQSQEEDEETEEEEEEEMIEIPKEFIFGVDFDIPVDPSVLHFERKLTRKGKGGKRAKIFSTSLGKFVKAIFPKGERRGRLAIGAILRAAAPHQKIRKELLSQHKLKYGRHNHPKVIVTKDDFRIQRLARKAGTLVVFVVDASGSMALNRMGAAKGAAMLLLKEAYKSRDKIALIEFHGTKARVLVPPTKSMSMTKNRLESMPCGGGSPLAHALETAIRTGLNEIKIKRDVGRVIVVLLTDGRANVPLGVSRGDTQLNDDESMISGISSDRKLLREEIVALAKQFSTLKDFDFLCIDTEDQFVGTGIARDVTKACFGTYHHLTGAADTKAVSRLVQKGMQQSGP